MLVKWHQRKAEELEAQQAAEERRQQLEEEVEAASLNISCLRRRQESRVVASRTQEYYRYL